MRCFDKTYGKWRRQMLWTNLVLALIVLVVETIIFFIFRRVDLLLMDVSTYLLWFLFLPATVNGLVIVAGFWLEKRLPHDSDLINYVPVVQQTLLCLVVACTHFVFPVTLCVFVFPLFATVIFSSRKMTLRIGELSALFMAAALLNRKLSPFAFHSDPYFWSEAIVAFTVLVAAVLVCLQLTRYQREKNMIIYQSLQQQLEMQEQLSKDPKTGLYGHAALMNKLDSQIARACAGNMRVALAMIDVDDFKQINDTYGHLRGDEVLLQLARYLEANNPDNHLIARFGGDEFAVLFIGAQVDRARAFVDTIHTGFARQTAACTDKPLSLSIGLAIWKPGWSKEDLLSKADHAMYAAKAGGKNRVVQVA